jgi:hypothetical protein
MATTSTTTTTTTGGGMGGMMSSSSTATGGGMGGSGGMMMCDPLVNSCDSCNLTDTNTDICSGQQGNTTNGIGWNYGAPACKADPNSSALCSKDKVGCRACRLCYPANQAGPNCDICADPSGSSCDGTGGITGKPGGAFVGDEYCPPCVCEKFKSTLMINLGLTEQQALAMCQGDYQACCD